MLLPVYADVHSVFPAHVFVFHRMSPTIPAIGNYRPQRGDIDRKPGIIVRRRRSVLPLE